jgi:hypothetical protein
MKHRKLRIAWSVAWGIVVVLLIALWVRSYWIADIVYYRPTTTTMFGTYSNAGVVFFYDGSASLTLMGDPPSIGWTLTRSWNAGYASDAADDTTFKKVFRGFKLQLNPLASHAPD